VITWDVIFTGLKLIVQLLGWLQSKGYIEQGREEERAAAARELLRAMQVAIGVQTELKNKTDEEIDAIARSKGWYRD
jgi:hypothetical protein